MKQTMILPLILVALVLQACAGLTPSDKAPIVLPEMSSQFAQCSAPVKIPDRAIKQSEAEKLWAEDRTNLKVCRGNLEGTLRYYNELRTGLIAASVK